MSCTSLALCSNSHRYDPIKKLKLFQGLISWLNIVGACMSILNGAAFSNESISIRETLKTLPPDHVIHSGSDHPRGISAPSFCTTPL